MLCNLDFNIFNICFWCRWSQLFDGTNSSCGTHPDTGDPPKDLQRSQHSGCDVTHIVDLGHCSQRDLDCPGKTQDHVFYNGTVIVGLGAEERLLVDQLGCFVCVWYESLPCVGKQFLLWERCFLRLHGRTDPSPCADPRSACTKSWQLRRRWAGRRTCQRLHVFVLK